MRRCATLSGYANRFLPALASLPRSGGIDPPRQKKTEIGWLLLLGVGQDIRGILGLGRGGAGVGAGAAARVRINTAGACGENCEKPAEGKEVPQWQRKNRSQGLP